MEERRRDRPVDDDLFLFSSSLVGRRRRRRRRMASSMPSPEKSVISRKTRCVPSTCRVCDAPAVYSYFGGITCHSCKMFFKRNAELGLVSLSVRSFVRSLMGVCSQESLRCDFDGDCPVTILSRHVCTACRLDKCFWVGMRTELIRCSRQKKKNTAQASEPRRRIDR
jgi:nuclear receptor subfamily 1 group I